jgi:D-3-phosphoglycerate dehydrogenase
MPTAARYDAIYVNTARVPGRGVARRAGCVVARHGVGYDTVAVPALTRAGVLVTNTPSSMPRPVATIALTFLLALAGKLFLKHRLTRSGRWHERMDNMGLGLTGRTLGVIGAGRIGRELLSMARTFDLKLLATDPMSMRSSWLTGARKVALRSCCSSPILSSSACSPGNAPSDDAAALRDAAGSMPMSRADGRRRGGADRGA